MSAASRLSAAMGLLSREDVERIECLLAAFGLPLSMEIDGSLVWDALWKDKKKEGKEVHFVLLEGIGNARIVPISIDALKGVIDDLCQHR
jgi:3-dehydroquinate synthase